MPALTFAPLPSFHELCSAIIHPALTNEELAAPWCRINDRGFWFSRSAWSMRAIAEWRFQMNDNNPVTVWIPDFFCNASLAPLREMGVQLLFYPITSLLSPDIVWCQTQALIYKPDIFILVHYFGQPSPTAEVVELCKNTGAWLVEDATHVLKPIIGVGEQGDCVLYSQHKHLAIPDGALLVVRENGPSLLGNANSIKVLKKVSDKLILESSNSISSILIWATKRMMQLIGIRGKKQPAPFWPDLNYDGKYCNYKKMSSLAKKLLSSYCYNLEKIAQLRQMNKRIWKNYLYKKGDGQNLISSWQMHETPYLAAFIVDDFEKITLYYNQLKINRIPVSTWPDLPPEVIDNPTQHSNAIHIRKTRLYLVVHQTLCLKNYLKNLHIYN